MSHTPLRPLNPVTLMQSNECPLFLSLPMRFLAQNREVKAVADAQPSFPSSFLFQKISRRHVAYPLRTGRFPIKSPNPLRRGFTFSGRKRDGRKRGCVPWCSFRICWGELIASAWRPLANSCRHFFQICCAVRGRLAFDSHRASVVDLLD